jgi:hypothetical protein
MKVKLKDLVEAVPALENIKRQKPKDVKLGYSIGKNIRLIEQKLAEQYNDKRNELVLQFGEENKEGAIIVPPGTRKMIEFNKALDALQDIEEEIDLWVLDLTKLQQAGIELTIDDITRLFFMAEVGEAEVAK